MTLLTLLFSSEGTCVGMHVCGSMCWSWRKPTQRFLRTKQTHGFICYNNRLATFCNCTLKILSQSCHRSLLLLNAFPGSSFSELGFKPLCVTVLQPNWVSLLCSFMSWPPAPSTCSTCSSFSSSVFSCLYLFVLVFTVVRRWPASLWLWKCIQPKATPALFLLFLYHCSFLFQSHVNRTKVINGSLIPQYKEHVLYPALCPSVSHGPLS